MTDNDLLILVDEHDLPTGLKGKLEVHQDGDLHRALSVFVFDAQGRMLLQQRAEDKYHSGGLWTNTCCSHPRQGEEVRQAAVRRLHEEMGLRCPELEPAFTFIYKAAVGNGLTEHELDHVFIAVSNDLPQPNPAEVQNYRYASPAEVKQDLVEHPERYTAWFRLIFDRVSALQKQNAS